MRWIRYVMSGAFYLHLLASIMVYYQDMRSAPGSDTALSDINI